MEFEPQSPLPATEPENHRRGHYGAQNLAVLGLQIGAWAALLTLMDRGPWWGQLAGLVLFLWVMQGLFSMMHEFFHGNAHRDPQINHGMGLVGALIFGSSATLHRINHWGHHVRNRTSAERGEFVHQGEGTLQKTLLYYFATMGGLWIGGFVFPILSIALPYSAARWLMRKPEFNTYTAAFEQFKPADWAWMRLEGALLLIFWSLVLWVGPWQPLTVVVAYGALAYHWSVLQWIYHLNTPLDVVEGAYNLRLPTPVRWLWLNFNYNLTHHRNPSLAWQDLPAHTDLAETQPLWYRYLLMWRPPRPFPEDLGELDKRYF